MIASRASPLARIVCARSFCSSEMGVSISRLVIPITALSGVRISWLMFARNRLFARAADSASCLACSSTAACILRSVMSVVVPMYPTSPSLFNWTGTKWPRTQVSRPSGRRNLNSSRNGVQASTAAFHAA